jgi:hypothetical protein
LLKSKPIPVGVRPRLVGSAIAGSAGRFASAKRDPPQRVVVVFRDDLVDFVRLSTSSCSTSVELLA